MSETKTQLPPLSPKMQERVNNKKLLFVMAEMGLFSGAIPLGPNKINIQAVAKKDNGDTEMYDYPMSFIRFHGTADEFAVFAHKQIDNLVKAVKGSNMILLGPDHVNLPNGALVQDQLLNQVLHGVSVWRDPAEWAEEPKPDLGLEKTPTVPLDQEKTKP